MKIVILDGFAVNPGDLDWGFMDRFGDIVIYDSTPKDKAAERCKNADIVITNRATINASFLDACPTVKYISALGTGYDMIDVELCAKRGVEVSNVPGYSSPAVAQFTFALILSLVTDIAGFGKMVEDGKWTGVPGVHYESNTFLELQGLTLGLIGYGAIGKKVAEIAGGFDMNVVAVTGSKTSGKDGDVSFTTLEELVKVSDIISLHCPLNARTTKMINGKLLEKVKDGCYLINTARGGLLDEQAVADALNTGKLAGAGLDVLAVEPPDKNNPLLKAKNCIITPHAAWVSVAARKRLLEILEKNIESFINTGKSIHSLTNP